MDLLIILLIKNYFYIKFCLYPVTYVFHKNKNSYFKSQTLSIVVFGLKYK